MWNGKKKKKCYEPRPHFFILCPPKTCLYSHAHRRPRPSFLMSIRDFYRLPRATFHASSAVLQGSPSEFGCSRMFFWQYYTQPSKILQRGPSLAFSSHGSAWYLSSCFRLFSEILAHSYFVGVPLIVVQFSLAVWSSLLRSLLASLSPGGFFPFFSLAMPSSS